MNHEFVILNLLIMKKQMRIDFCLLFIAIFLFCFTSESEAKSKKPNLIFIIADDLGYGDLSCYGAQDVNTIHIDKLANEGLRFTDFQVTSSVCSPSRASILTGRYPMRNGVPVPPTHLEKHKNYGLAANEITLADVLLEENYATMCIGKWHLGFIEGSRPLDHGFEHFYGHQVDRTSGAQKLLNIYDDDGIVKTKVLHESLTETYTQKAIQFIEENKKNHFFLYLAYTAVHSPIVPSEAFRGTSRGSLYGDFVQELDHYVGQLMQAINENGLDRNTIVVFLSDNGPAICHFGGSAGVLNGGKYSTMEGGFRVPAIIRWKGEYSKGTCNTLLSSMDLFPTIAALAGAKLPEDRTFDGKDINSILKSGEGQSPHQYLYYYNGANLQAVRKGKWKLHLPRTADDQPWWSKNLVGQPFKGSNLKNIPCNGLVALEIPLLFNLDTDMGELTDISKKHPDIVKELLNEADRVRSELGDVHVIGSDQRLPPFENIQDKF